MTRRWGLGTLVLAANIALSVLLTSAFAEDAVPPTIPPEASSIPSLPLAPPAPSSQPAAPTSLPQGALTSPDPSKPVSLLASLAPPASESNLPDQVILSAKSALVLHGKSEWEKSYQDIRSVVDRGNQFAAKAGLTVSGYPLCVFVETNDLGFTYDILLPLSSAPSAPPADMPPEMSIGKTPEGKALRFIHVAPYEDIDSTYEQITNFLDAKDITAKDAFIEEYLIFGENASAATTSVNIFVQPKN